MLSAGCRHDFCSSIQDIQDGRHHRSCSSRCELSALCPLCPLCTLCTLCTLRTLYTLSPALSRSVLICPALSRSVHLVSARRSASARSPRPPPPDSARPTCSQVARATRRLLLRRPIALRCVKCVRQILQEQWKSMSFLTARRLVPVSGSSAMAQLRPSPAVLLGLLTILDA
jgi:hypothetical protein